MANTCLAYAITVVETVVSQTKTKLASVVTSPVAFIEMANVLPVVVDAAIGEHKHTAKSKVYGRKCFEA